MYVHIDTSGYGGSMRVSGTMEWQMFFFRLDLNIVRSINHSNSGNDLFSADGNVGLEYLASGPVYLMILSVYITFPTKGSVAVELNYFILK